MPSSTSLKYVLAIDYGLRQRKGRGHFERGRNRRVRHSPHDRRSSWPAAPSSRIPRNSGARCERREGGDRSRARRPRPNHRRRMHHAMGGHGPVDEDGLAIGTRSHGWTLAARNTIARSSGGWPRVQGYGWLKLLKWLRLLGRRAGSSRASTDSRTCSSSSMSAPTVYARTYKFLEPMDYLNLRLTGNFAASLRDDVHATGRPTFATPTRSTTDPSCSRSGSIAPSCPTSSGRTRCSERSSPRSPRSRPRRVDSRGDGPCDGQAATIGAGAMRDFDGYFYIGTTAWMSCHIPAQENRPGAHATRDARRDSGPLIVGAEQGDAGRASNF